MRKSEGSMQLHQQATQIKKILEENGINILYHFTEIDNLALVSRYGGLWSKEKLQEKGIFDEVKTGGNELSLKLDKELGNWDKIHLYFCPNTPMAYRKQENTHIVYALIKPEVATWEGALFTDTNATRKQDGHRKGQGVKGLGLVDFKTIKETIEDGPKPWDRTWHRNVQAEILAPESIPLDCIDSIAFISEASLKEGKRLWGNIKHPPFKVDEGLFYEGFPYVKDTVLTPQEVNKDNVGSIKFTDKREFIIGQYSKITLLTHLKAVPGLQVKILWIDSDNRVISTDNAEFEKGGDYWHWSDIEIERLGVGNYFVDYHLGDIRWAKILFKVRRRYGSSI